MVGTTAFDDPKDELLDLIKSVQQTLPAVQRELLMRAPSGNTRTRKPGAEARSTEGSGAEAPRTEVQGANTLNTEAPGAGPLRTEGPGAEVLSVESPGIGLGLVAGRAELLRHKR